MNILTNPGALFSREENKIQKITLEITKEDLHKARNPFMDSFDIKIVNMLRDTPHLIVIVESYHDGESPPAAEQAGPAAAEAPADYSILAGPQVSDEETDPADRILSADGILAADGISPADEILPADGIVPAG